MSTHVFIDNSGSTYGASRYWERVGNVANAYPNAKFVYWNTEYVPTTCTQVLENVARGKQLGEGGTSISTIYAYLMCHPEIKAMERLVIVTDGQVDMESVRRVRDDIARSGKRMIKHFAFWGCVNGNKAFNKSKAAVLTVCDEATTTIRLKGNVVHKNGALFFQRLPNLTRLDLDRDCELRETMNMIPLAVQKKLVHIQMRYNPLITSVEALRACTALQRLDLHWCKQLISVEGLGGCKALQSLDLSNCVQLTSVEALGGCTALQKLDLHWCKQLISVEGLGGCKALQSLYLWGCEQLTSVEGLGGCKALQTLDLYNCNQLTSVEGLGGCTALQTLLLWGCFQLTSVEALGGCKALQSLNLMGCKQLLTFLDDLQSKPGLKILR